MGFTSLHIAAAGGPAQAACPFNTRAYGASLALIGEVEMDAGGRLAVLRRPIGDTGLFDGAGPWPYLWLDGPRDLAVLTSEFRHLVTLTAVTQPGYAPPAGLVDAIMLKEHYVYDPSLPTPDLSPRARGRLAQCEKRASFQRLTRREDRLAIVDIYRGLKLRRNLLGGFFDYDAAHFEVLADLEDSVFFSVSDGNGIGAMGCGVIFHDVLQMLHMPVSDAGLRWNASYLMMSELQKFARAHGLRLMTGGLPAGASDGLRVFKERWANAMLPVYLLRIVSDPKRYDALCLSMSGDPGFFPAYRRRT